MNVIIALLIAMLMGGKDGGGGVLLFSVFDRFHKVSASTSALLMGGAWRGEECCRLIIICVHMIMYLRIEIVMGVTEGRWW